MSFISRNNYYDISSSNEFKCNEESKEQHKDDVQLLEGLWESCNGELFIDQKKTNLTQFLWQKYKEFNNLVYVYLSDNKLKEIDGRIFYTFPNLYWLDLRNNQLTYFPKEVENHQKLNTILLDNNKILELPIELGSLPELKGLSIFENPIKLPSDKLLELRQSQLLDYFLRSWQSKSFEVPLTVDIQRENKFLPKIPREKQLKKVEDAGQFVTRNWRSRDTIDQVLADTLVKNIETQNNILQKRKNIECLKEWRERYTTNKEIPLFKTMNVPPYGTYEQYSKMPDRWDIKTTLNVKPKPKIFKPNRKRHEFLAAELKRIQETMANIRSAQLPTDLDEKSLNAAMATKIADIKALREIQRRVNSLRLQ